MPPVDRAENVNTCGPLCVHEANGPVKRARPLGTSVSYVATLQGGPSCRGQPLVDIGIKGVS